MRSSIALWVVILSRTTDRALSNQGVSGRFDVLRARLDWDRAPGRGEPSPTGRLAETLARLAFRDRGGAREECLIRESTDRAARRHRGYERCEVRVSGEPRIPRDGSHRIPCELDDPRVRAAHVQDVERRSARAGKYAQVVGRAEPAIFAVVERGATSPRRRRPKDPLPAFAARPRELPR